jgi:hypothetical protein
LNSEAHSLLLRRKTKRRRKAGLIGGLYFGIKNAEKGWEKDWQGWPEEFALGVYAKSES